MFCRLFELKTITGIDLIKDQDCVRTCEHYKEDSCTITKDVSVRLSSEKYGWMISTKINFKQPVSSKSGNISYVKMIRLIHPVHTDVWISICNRKDVEGIFYTLFIESTSRFPLDKIEDLNKSLKEKCGYDGRDLNELDFNIGG